MCTVTLIPLGDAAAPGLHPFRLVCNRDERCSRAAADPPTESLRGKRRAVYPIDAQAGGTWVGVNDAGLAMALLNLNEPDMPTTAYPSSRGDIIPALLSFATMDEALRTAAALPPDRFAPFRLVICDGMTLACIAGRPSGHKVAVAHFSRRPFMFTSSGLGDHIVRKPRRALFRNSFSGTAYADRWPREQDAFHNHHWSDRPEVSILMSRRDARTVSRTIIEVDASSSTLQYTALIEGGALTPFAHTLVRECQPEAVAA